VQWGSCCSSSFCSFKVRGNILYLLWVAWRTLGLLDGIPRVLSNKPTPLMALWDTGMPGSTMGTPGSTPGMLGSAGHHIPIYTKSLGLHACFTLPVTIEWFKKKSVVKWIDVIYHDTLDWHNQEVVASCLRVCMMSSIYLM
jgi:hypothetical protein